MQEELVSTSFNVSPWDCGDLLSQGLDVGELDGLSSSSGFYHITLRTGDVTVSF